MAFADISTVRGSVNVRNFSAERFKLKLTGNKVRVIGVQKDGIVTSKEIATVKTDDGGDFVFDPAQDVCKIAVVERHHGTGQVGVGLLGGGGGAYKDCYCCKKYLFHGYCKKINKY